MFKFTLAETDEFSAWLKNQTAYCRVQVANRTARIKLYGHFGIQKYLKDDVWELKWKNGLRVYYAHQPQTKILLLLGGTKHGQDKDVTKAKKIYKSYA